jgi:hypothetical protein
MKLLSGLHCLHFDRKKVKQIEEDLGFTLNVERIE